MELRRIFDTISRWYWLILLAAALAAISGYVALRQQPRLYSATATIMVGRSMRDPNPNTDDLYLGQQLAETYKEIAQRRSVRDATMAALGLEWLPAYSVTPLPNTQLLEIRVNDASPQLAYTVANELAAQLIALSPTAQGTMRSDRSVFLERQVQDLETSITDTEAQIDELQARLRDLYSARDIATTQEQITALQSKLRDYQTTYADLIVLVEGGTNSLQIVEPAVLPTEPMGSDLARSLLVLTLLGLLLGLGAAFLLDYLDDVYRTPEEAEQDLKLPVFSSVMRIQGEEPRDRLMTNQRTLSPDAESYRLVLTGLDHSGTPPVIMFTSAGPKEGKSLTVANLGLIMAQEGRRVVLVDADLRHPTLHELFGKPNNEGLSNALTGRERSATTFLQDSGFENLRLLTSGKGDANPAVLLRSDALRGVLDALKEDADIVVVDTPPVLAVTDPIAIALIVDGVLLVVDASSTKRRSAMQTLRALQGVDARVLGVVLNRVKRRASLYYQYDYYYASRGQSTDQNPPQAPRGKRRWLPDVGWGR